MSASPTGSTPAARPVAHPIPPAPDPSPGAWTTRIAPTPSGFLHAGNLVNMLLTAWWADSMRGRLVLRIDDFDAGRVRPEYLADIFDMLDWLGIVCDEGPSHPREFAENWSMSLRRDQFAAARDLLLAEHPGRVFVCRCSRQELSATGACRAGCRSAGLSWSPGELVVRLHVPPGLTTVARSGDAVAKLLVPAGDHVLWRRDDLPAYQLGSVVVDASLGVTAVLRGRDLLDSSALQLFLAGLLPASTFIHADLRHHALLADDAGHKLSKSAGTRASALPRSEALRAALHARAVSLGASIGIAPPD